MASKTLTAIQDLVKFLLLAMLRKTSQLLLRKHQSAGKKKTALQNRAGHQKYFFAVVLQLNLSL